MMQVTYSSDHFEQLYRLAVKLIETGHAYVDHQTAAEIKESRCDTSQAASAPPYSGCSQPSCVF